MAATLDARIRLDSSQFSGGLNRAMRETNVAVGKMSAQFSTLKNVLGGGLVGAFGFNIAAGLLDATVEVEKLESAMSATAGSADLGRKYMRDVRALAGEIGLEVGAAAKAMIQFSSAGMTAGQSMEMVKAGFNAIASSGGGAAEFSRFAVAIQQLRNSPKPLQEELNQLREALPTTAKLMQEAFGARRAEDLQKLGITGKQFVDGFLAAMQGLPQIGDTLGKEIGRFKAQWEAFKAEIGDGLRPIASGVMTSFSFITQAFSSLNESIGIGVANMRGFSDEMIETGRRAGEANAEMFQSLKDTNEALDSLLEAQAKDAASKNRSIEQGKTLSTIFSKFNDILREGADAARKFAAELDFEDRMNAFKDQERNNAFEESLDETRRKTAEAIRAKREAQGDAFNDFVGPQQMTDDEREDWRNRIAREGMTRSDRKAERAAKREQDENTRKAADRKTREQMREIEKEKRANAFDDLKKNKGFFDEEGTKRRLKDKNREDAKHAVQSAAQTLTDIKAILQTLATA